MSKFTTYPHPRAESFKSTRSIAKKILSDISGIRLKKNIEALHLLHTPHKF